MCRGRIELEEKTLLVKAEYHYMCQNMSEGDLSENHNSGMFL